MSETNEKQTTPELNTEDLGTISGGTASGDGTVLTAGNSNLAGWDVKSDRKV